MLKKKPIDSNFPKLIYFKTKINVYSCAYACEYAYEYGFVNLKIIK